jgi:homoserine dehydrogenase
MSDIKIGLFGFGCVGQGLYDILSKSKGFKAEITKICVKDKNKKRSLPQDYYTYDKNVLLNNPDINLIVELIDDADEAYEIVKTALQNGKNVVTANKKMVANHLEELVELQHKHNVSLLYEASSCGSIPVIRNLEEYYDNELLNSVSGIFNGSSNYILSKIFNEGISYDLALKQAQDLGFVETDPTLDIGGFDPKFKLVIIAAHSFGLFIDPNDVLNIGIQNFSDFDIQYAREKGYKIKLVATARKIDEKNITLFVMPQFVKPSGHLYNVENEYNAVIVEAAFSDTQFFLGKGAGGHPTGMAVLSDISALRYNYKYEYKRHLQHQELAYSTDIELEVYLRYTNESILSKIGFTNITERFSGAQSNYVIGTISMKNIIKNKALLESEKAFIVNTGKIIPVGAKKSAEKEVSSKKITV